LAAPRAHDRLSTVPGVRSCAALLRNLCAERQDVLQRGEKLREEQRLEQAIEKYNLAIQVEPGMLKAWSARADVYAQLGKMQESAADRKRVAELDPADASLGAAAGKAFLELGQYQDARTLCDNALRVDPKNMEALQSKTRACLALGDLDCADGGLGQSP
jgi:tetratricopeptide (TPR) repeat protein